MKTIFLAALLLGGPTLAAHAESFTFKSTATTQNAIQVKLDNGGVVRAEFASGTSLVTTAAGKTLHATFTCESHSAPPPVGIFQVFGLCNGADEGGGYSILMGCNPTSKDAPGVICVGKLIGESGAYAGRSGAASWQIKPSADGKTGQSVGQGAWNE